MRYVPDHRVEDIRPAPRNTRRHPERQLRALEDFIARVGFRMPVHLDSSGVVIAGHARLEVARRMRMTTVPAVVHDDLDDKGAAALRIADNKFAELSVDDDVALVAELAALGGEYPMEQLGMSDRDIKAWLAAQSETPDDDGPPTPPEPEKNPRQSTCPKCGFKWAR